MADFKETQRIDANLREQIEAMTSYTSLKLALNLNIPMDPNNSDLKGCPTKLGADGQTLFVDTELLKDLVFKAIQERDYTQVPDVLGLQQAVINIIGKNPTITDSIRPRDTVPNIPPERISKALKEMSDNEITPPTGTPILSRKNREFAKTRAYEPFKPKPQEE